MTDLPDDFPALNLRAELVRIDRDRAETQKLLAEARKLNVDRWLAPLVVLAALLAAMTGVLGLIIGSHALRIP